MRPPFHSPTITTPTKKYLFTPYSCLTTSTISGSGSGSGSAAFIQLGNHPPEEAPFAAGSPPALDPSPLNAAPQPPGRAGMPPTFFLPPSVLPAAKSALYFCSLSRFTQVVACSVGWFVGWLVHWLVCWLVCWLVRWLLMMMQTREDTERTASTTGPSRAEVNRAEAAAKEYIRCDSTRGPIVVGRSAS